MIMYPVGVKPIIDALRCFNFVDCIISSLAFEESSFEYILSTGSLENKRLLKQIGEKLICVIAV